MKKRGKIAIVLVMGLLVSLFADATHRTRTKAEGYGLSNPLMTEEESIWDCVYFGSYWQTDTNGNGLANRKDDKEPIKWRVLSIEGNDAFLISDMTLDYRNYHAVTEDITWEECDLRKWLNEDFYQEAFSEEEKGAIITTLVDNKVMEEFSTTGGNDTYDNVYLPSAQEMLNSDYGFSGDRFRSVTRSAKNSPFAITCGASMDTTGTYAGNGYYRLRSIGDIQSYASIVNPDGYLYHNGDRAHFSFAIRPVLHLDLSSSVWEKAGTVSSLEAIASEATPSPTPTVTPTAEPTLTITPAPTPTVAPTATPAPKKKELKRPTISVKKKSTMGIRYLSIKLKKYEGKYVQIYLKKGKGKFKRLILRYNKIKKYKGHIYLQYAKKKQTLYIKVRTYKIKNKKKIYSKFSKTVRIKT